MERLVEDSSTNFEAILAAERVRLVRACARFTGDPDAAEDLAQETLTEAWRNRGKLYDERGAAPWLFAIARNVCLRWARRQGREYSRFVLSPNDDAEQIGDDALDLAGELERDELARLLDRALARLPAETRTAMVAHYIEDVPQAGIALRMGLSEGAVAMRIRRGKLAMRHLLATEMRDTAAEYGFATSVGDRWEDAHRWCPICARHRLQARLIRATGELTIRCPGCTPAPGFLSQATMPLLHDQTASGREGVSRLLGWMHDGYFSCAPTGWVQCTRCGCPTTPTIVPLGAHYAPQLRNGTLTACVACGHRDVLWLSGIALALPEGRQLWREQRRVRVLGERDVEAAGRPAVVLGLESVGSAARLEVVVARDTLAVIETRATGI